VTSRSTFALGSRSLGGVVAAVALTSVTLLGAGIVRADAPQLVATLRPVKIANAFPAWPNASGSVRVWLGSDPGVICFDLSFSKVPDFPNFVAPTPTVNGPQFLLYILRGTSLAGDPRIAFVIKRAATIACASGFAGNFISDLFTNPQAYYVTLAENLDTAKCDSPPGTLCYSGAIRGQLDFAPGSGPLPNTATAPRASSSEAVLPSLGFLMILIATAVLAESMRRRQRPFDASEAEISEL
jgi:hypothetical protein